MMYLHCVTSTSKILYLKESNWHIKFHKLNLDIQKSLKSSISKIVLVLDILLLNIHSE